MATLNYSQFQQYRADQEKEHLLVNVGGEQKVKRNRQIQVTSEKVLQNQ